MNKQLNILNRSDIKLKFFSNFEVTITNISITTGFVLIYSIIFIIPFLQKVLFGGFSKLRIKINNENFIQKRFYSNYYKFENNIENEMLKELKDLMKEKNFTENQFNTLKSYIIKNCKHYKFGEEIIEKDGSITFYAYDLTTKGESKVYFKLDNKTKDEFISVWKNEKGQESFVNKISIKRNFKDKEEFSRKVRKVEDYEEMNMKLGINKEGQKTIGEKIKNMHNNSVEEIQHFSMDKSKYEVEISKRDKFTDLEEMGGMNKNDPFDQV